MRVRAHAIFLLALVLGGCAAAGPLPLGAVRCRGSSAPAVWTVQPGDVLQGVVGDTYGRPIVGAHVRVRRLGADSTAERPGETGRHGAFGIDSVPPGRYAAHAHARFHGVWVDTVELAYDRGTVPRIQLCTRPMRRIG